MLSKWHTIVLTALVVVSGSVLLLSSILIEGEYWTKASAIGTILMALTTVIALIVSNDKDRRMLEQNDETIRHNNKMLVQNEKMLHQIKIDRIPEFIIRRESVKIQKSTINNNSPSILIFEIFNEGGETGKLRKAYVCNQEKKSLIENNEERLAITSMSTGHVRKTLNGRNRPELNDESTIVIVLLYKLENEIKGIATSDYKKIYTFPYREIEKIYNENY